MKKFQRIDPEFQSQILKIGPEKSLEVSVALDRDDLSKIRELERGGKIKIIKELPLSGFVLLELPVSSIEALLNSITGTIHNTEKEYKALNDVDIDFKGE